MGALAGCNGLPFSAKIAVAPDLQSASTSTGLTVKVSVPQEAGANANGLRRRGREGHDRDAARRRAAEPSAGDGLQACTGDPSALSAGQLASPGDEIGYQGEAEVDPGLRAMTFSERLPNPLSLEQGDRILSGRVEDREREDQDAAAAQRTEGLGVSRQRRTRTRSGA